MASLILYTICAYQQRKERKAHSTLELGPVRRTKRKQSTLSKHLLERLHHIQTQRCPSKRAQKQRGVITYHPVAPAAASVPVSSQNDSPRTVYLNAKMEQLRLLELEDSHADPQVEEEEEEEEAPPAYETVVGADEQLRRASEPRIKHFYQIVALEQLSVS
ncbi:MAG: hypothetical protein M1829_000222 [Trizodia sp. TS-e1964]|nr:MAG: hypothetical protein M1829_000222 [Trizodia sp. TS-e1964]